MALSKLSITVLGPLLILAPGILAAAVPPRSIAVHTLQSVEARGALPTSTIVFEDLHPPNAVYDLPGRLPVSSESQPEDEPIDTGNQHIKRLHMSIYGFFPTDGPIVTRTQRVKAILPTNLASNRDIVKPLGGFEPQPQLTKRILPTNWASYPDIIQPLEGFEPDPQPSASVHLSARSVDSKLADEDLWNYIIIRPENDLLFPDPSDTQASDETRIEESTNPPGSELPPSNSDDTQVSGEVSTEDTVMASESELPVRFPPLLLTMKLIEQALSNDFVLPPDMSALTDESLQPGVDSAADDPFISLDDRQNELEIFKRTLASGPLDHHNALTEDPATGWDEMVESTRPTEDRSRAMTRILEQMKLVFVCLKTQINGRKVQLFDAGVYGPHTGEEFQKYEYWWTCMDGGWVHFDWWVARKEGHNPNQLGYAKEQYYSPEMPTWAVNSSIFLPAYHWNHRQYRYVHSRLIYHCLAVSRHMERPAEGPHRDYEQCERGCWVHADRWDRGLPQWYDLEPEEERNRMAGVNYNRVPEYNHLWRMCIG